MAEGFFNVALFPDEAEFRDTCVRLAQANLKDLADHYLIGKGALPHITLCQFHAPQSQLSTIWTMLSHLSPKTLAVLFHHLYILPGKKTDLGGFWVGLTVQAEPDLVDLQKAVYDSLGEQGIKRITAPANYFPHLTWANCPAGVPALSVMPPEDFWTRRYKFSLSIGQSDAAGVYHEKLFPSG
jgi:hypothetical protein